MNFPPLLLRWMGPFSFAALLFLGAVPSAWANILGNPGFEGGIGDSAVNWDNTNGTVQTTTVPGGFSAFPEGTGAIVQDATSDFTFQTKRDIQPGDLVVFSILAESSVAAGGGSGGQLRIEFKRIDPTTGLDFLISDVTSDLITSTNAPAGVGYVRFTASGRAPVETDLVVFTIRRQGANAGTVVYDDANGEINPARLTLSASRTTVRPGDVVTVTADLRNESTQAQSSVELKVEVPSGLDVIEGSIRHNGSPTSVKQGSVIIVSNSTVSANDNIRIAFQVLVTSGVALGKAYEIRASVLAGGGRISEERVVVLRVQGDPTFDEGTVLGKVFDDRNEDGMQTRGEIGVPGVRIFTEYGVSVVTDSNGQFHLPAVRPARHVLKVDGHTLPDGTRFLTEESLVIKMTPGLLTKVRFAVHLPDSALPEEFKKDLQIWVTQGVDLVQPQLQIRMEPDSLKVGLGRLEREPVFRIKTNYPEYLWSWRIEILNELGEKIWSGIGAKQVPSVVPWNGMTDAGEMIRPGVYAYRMVVRDAKDHEDWTPLQFFHVVHKAESLERGGSPPDLPATGAFSVLKDGKRSIPLVASPTVRIYGKTQPGRRVQVNDLPVDVGPTGEFEQDLFVKPGEKKIIVTSASTEGDRVSVEESLTVKDSSFFLVALGEEELGVNFTKGSVETVAHDDAYHEGFYNDGRLSYYLKAKMKGRFLVKSRYDTADERSELFTHLDPDAYYPVYGDYSQIEYEGQDTRERLYLLVEMDRSHLKWGSYHTNFTDTELSRYNRTLSGLKIHHETLSATKYGDAKRGFSLFWSQPDHLADHNEFRGTGGTLYYLRNRNVIPGGEKVRVEIRDKIQDIPIESRDLLAGKDYEIDYRQGRILLTEPLSSVSASETIISNDILDGNSVYLIVDYEFETYQIFKERSAGLRGYTHLGHHIRVGGTAVEEKRQNMDYDLRGVDAVIKAGRNTKVTMELAQAKLQQVRQATSFNGGLSFQNQSPIGIRRPRETAYLIKAETKPLEPLEVSGYLQQVQPGFSVDRIKSQEAFRKYGLQAKLKLGNSFHILGRQDSTDLVSQLRPLPESRSAALERLRSTTFQAVFDNGPWNIVGEYLHQHIETPLRSRIPSFFSEMPFGNAFGLKAGRRISDWLTPYVKGQYAFSGENNFQAGGGAEVRVGGRTKIFFEEMVSAAGDATLLGVSRQHDEKTTSYANIKVRDSYFGARQVSTSVGSSHQLSERSRVYSERQYSTYTGSLPLSLAPTFWEDIAVPGLWSSDLYGYEAQFWDRWDFGARFERRHLDADDFRALSDFAETDVLRANTFNTLRLSLGYADLKRFKESSSFEVRLDPDAPEVRQWVMQELMEWKLNRDLSFLGRAHFGTSRFVERGDLTGRFVELNTGFAYRPVEWDRLNVLAKYTFLDEVASDAQFVTGDAGFMPTDEWAHIFSIEGAYDLSRHFQMVEKTAYRLGSFKMAVADPIDIGTFLWLNRLNYHLTRKWDVGVEYRMLFQSEAADTFRHGPLVEIDRELYDYIRLGIGYNFTDFEDDLRRVSDFQKNGFFIRLTGKV